MIKKFDERLEKDLKNVFHSDVVYRIFPNNDRLNATYKGSHLVS